MATSSSSTPSGGTPFPPAGRGGRPYGTSQAQSSPPVGVARPSHRSAPPGIYYFSIPVRPIRADISIEHLERLASYYGLYGSRESSAVSRIHPSFLLQSGPSLKAQSQDPVSWMCRHAPFFLQRWAANLVSPFSQGLRLIPRSIYP